MFSPWANLMVGKAWGTIISSAVLPHFILSVTLRPPMGFPLPCMVWTMVTPPVRQ